MLSNDILQKIDDETDIVALVSEFVSLEQKGKNYMGLCPFHDEKTPSFSVSTEKNIAMCMGCKQGGRPINFYRLIKNISFMEAASELASRIGIDLNINVTKKVDPNNHLYEIMEDASKFFEINLTNSLSGSYALEYLHKRNLDSETIKHFRLGYSSKDKDQLYQFLSSKEYKVSDMINLGLVKQSNDGSYYDLFNDRLMFPITNKDGKVVGFSGRTLSKTDNVKYVNSPETPIFKKGEIIYHLNESALDIRRLKHVILYEGFFDVIASYQAGATNAIATMGTALTTNQANLIKKTIDHVIIAFDGDNAGINAAISSIPILTNARLKVEVLSLPDKMDPDDYVKKHGFDAYQELLKTNVKDPYQFQFDYYQNITDFNNSNDIMLLEKNIGKMLSQAPAAIVSIYKEKLAALLNVDAKDLNIVIPKEKKSYQNNDMFIPPEVYYEPGEEFTDNTNVIIKPKKETNKKLAHRNINAEIRLLILMIRSQEWNDRLSTMLQLGEYSNPVLGIIRTKVIAQYNHTDFIDIEEFKQILNEEERQYFEKNIETDDFWKNQTLLNENEIEQYIYLVKSASDLRRIAHLKTVMTERRQKGKSIVHETEEYLRLKKEMEKLREDLINNGKVS